MTMMLDVTGHAAQRQAQRNLSDADIQFVLDYGRQHRNAGALHIFLGRRDIPRDAATIRRFGHLEGTVLVIDDTHIRPMLITVYRNRDGCKAIRTKAKYQRSQRASVHWDQVPE